MSGITVTWRRIRTRSHPESLISESDLELLISSEILISAEFDLDQFVLVAVVSPSDANDEGFESLVVSRSSFSFLLVRTDSVSVVINEPWWISEMKNVTKEML